MFASEWSTASNVSPVRPAPVPPDHRVRSHRPRYPSVFLVARSVGFHSLDTTLKFRLRTSSRRTDRAQHVSLFSSCRRIEAFCSRRQGFQRALPRAGDTVVGLVAREGHEGSVHLLQHNSKLGTLHSVFVTVGVNSNPTASMVISVICSADHLRIISDSLITPAKNASVYVEHCWTSSGLPVNSFGLPRPFRSMRLDVSFRI